MKNPHIEFLLPGTWTFVALADPAAAKRTIARLAEDALGRGDAQARVRAELRGQFTETADRARGAGGEAMWLCKEVAPGVPFPATLTLYRPSLSIPASDTREARLADVHALIGPARDGDIEADVTAGGRPAVRRVSLLAGRPVDEPDAAVLETVECTYWAVQPDDRGVLVVVATCAMPRLKDKLVALFDMIVSTMRWGAGEPADDLGAAEVEPADPVPA